MALYMALRAAIAAAATPTGPLNLTLYRVSPLAYPGLVNMDTGGLLSEPMGARSHSLTLSLFRAQVTRRATSASGSGSS